MKKGLFFVLALLSLMGTVVWGANVSVVLDGAPVVVDSGTGTPFLDSTGRVMVPLRVVLEKAGKRVTYDDVNRMAVISSEALTVSVPIDKPYVIINREIKANDAPARIVNGRTYLPIRIVMEAFGYKVGWDGSASKVMITSPESPIMDPALSTDPVVVEPKKEYSPNVVGNSNINLYNGGLVARENDDLYFVNFEDGDRIWHVNLLTGLSNKVSEKAARGINVVDGWVYYRQEISNDSWLLYKTRKDGTGTENVGTGNIQWLKVDGGYLYYYLSDEEALYRRKLTDLYGTKYYDHAMASINMDNGWLVYVKMKQDSAGKDIPGEIIKVNIETREEETLSTERSGSSEPIVTMIGNMLYFTRYNDALSLYSMDLATGDIAKVNDRWTYNVSGDLGSLYTLYPDNKEGLYRMDLSGTNEKRLSTEWRPGQYHDPGITVIGTKVYFLKKVTSTRYGWLCYDLISGKLRTLSEPADFVN